VDLASQCRPVVLYTEALESTAKDRSRSSRHAELQPSGVACTSLSCASGMGSARTRMGELQPAYVSDYRIDFWPLEELAANKDLSIVEFTNPQLCSNLRSGEAVTDAHQWLHVLADV